MQHLALNSGSHCRGDIRDDGPPVPEEVTCCTAGGLRTDGPPVPEEVTCCTAGGLLIDGSPATCPPVFVPGFFPTTNVSDSTILGR